METYRIKRASLDDIPALIEMRGRMFATLIDDEKRIEEMSEYSESYFREKIETGKVIAWIAEHAAGAAVACGALSFYYLTPKPFNLEGKFGYISSMYTMEEHRRRGLARRILQEILDYARDIDLRCIQLHASEVGEALYTSSGFKRWNEMGIELD